MYQAACVSVYVYIVYHCFSVHCILYYVPQIFLTWVSHEMITWSGASMIVSERRCRCRENSWWWTWTSARARPPSRCRSSWLPEVKHRKDVSSFTFRGVIISLPCLLWDMHRTIGTGSQSERRRWWRRRWWSPVQWRTRGRSRCWRRWRGWTDWWRTAWRRSRWWTRLWLVLCSAPSVPQPVVQSRRRPLLGPSPGWKRLLALSHLRHY